MNKELKVLFVEDSDDDLFLLIRALEKSGIKPLYERVQIAEDFEKMLNERSWDIIISDFALPAFGGAKALAILKEKQLQIPFIIVSGTIGEEIAASIMKAGANDYVMKDNLVRLGPAILRELGDIEKRRQLQRELDAKEEELRQAQKLEAVGTLAGGIAHDFNNILGILMLAASQVQSALADDHPAIRDLEIVNSAIEKGARLTKQLLIFSRKQEAQPQNVDINSVVVQMQKLMARLIGENISFELNLEQNLPLVFVDPGHIEQILMNLFVNARDAMPSGGKLTVKTSRKDDAFIKILISDTGTGMSEQVKSHIFDPFFTTKGPNKGTGLGLSVVFGIIKQAGGTIEVESVSGKGTDFHITLPAITTVLANIKPTEAEVIPTIYGKESVLLVEDEPELRELIEEVLKNNGYNVFAPETTQEAIQIGTNKSLMLDLLITDMMMPEVNGLDLATKISQAHPEIKVIVMSGYLEQELTEKIDSSSTQFFMQKPFSPNELIIKIQKIFDGTKKKLKVVS